MTRRRPALALLAPFLFVFLVAAKQRAVRPSVPLPSHAPAADVFSFSEPQQVTTKHVSLDLTIDFDARQVSGTARLDIENLRGTSRLILDTRALDIQSVTLDSGATASFSFGESSDDGTPLIVSIAPSTRSVTITYRSAPEASGLHWLNADQTLGRLSPYVYSLNEPDHARSWIPLQDTPSIRTTYDARLRVPRGMLALMTAPNPVVVNDLGVYNFSSAETVPSYLIAMAVGRIGFRSLSDRTGVYAEPELLDDAQWELQSVPAMLAAGERICGPYRWDRYDVLLMPPSFNGGMEHPRINFISPFSVITGNHAPRPDPSALIAHELAHSWSGDQVTTATWSDTWLNEGFASYLAIRLLEELSTSEVAEYLLARDRSTYSGFAGTTKDVESTRLHRGFRAGERPIAIFNSTSYTKGELFLRTMEDLAGRPAMDSFLRSYFATYAFHWVDDRAFLQHVRETVVRGDTALEQQLQLDEWIYGTGLPSNLAAPTSSALESRMAAEAAAFNAGRSASQFAVNDWNGLELDLFLGKIWSSLGNRMNEVDAAWNLSSRTTPPTTWLYKAIDLHYAPADPAVGRILMRGGTTGAVYNLYNRLLNAGRGSYAWSVYQTARPRYDAATQSRLDALFASFGIASHSQAA